MAYSEAAVLNFVHNTITAHEDIWNGNLQGDVVNLDGWTECLWLIDKSAGGTGTAVITVESCDDITPTTATAIAFDYQSMTSGNTWSSRAAATSSGFTTTAGANQGYKVWVRADELSGTDKFVRIVCTESANDPVDGAVVTLLLGPKYGQDPPAAAIS